MEEITGYIDHFIYQNTENGYGVAEISTEEEEVICVGNFPFISQGENVEVQGEYVEHPLYGKQLKIVSIRCIVPEDAYAMERYLGSGAIKGIGPALAKRIVKQFGKDTFRIMEQEPERLSIVKGISERKAIEISIIMEERKELRDSLIFLQKYGISNQLAMKILDRYGMNIYQILKENPYRLAEDIDGIGFKRADKIASLIGVKVDSAFRIQSGINYILGQAESEGHTFLPKEILLDRAEELLTVETESIENELPNLAMERKVVLKTKGDRVCCYRSTVYYEELACAKRLVDLSLSFSHTTKVEQERNRKQIEKQLQELEREKNITLDPLQKKAVCTAAENGLFILSGGPGTGKTTTINSMIRYFERSGMDILLAAPTGRAAKRMTEATGFEAKTIHRLLELNGSVLAGGGQVRFERTEDMPLETDVVVIDEVSMVDLHLLHALLKAISYGTRLVLVGDMNQLPSVGPGQVLRDLIESNAFPCVILDKIFRQAASSDIIVNAHKINKGENISLTTHSKDFLFLKRNNVDVIYKHMIQLILGNLPKYVDATPMQVQVLVPMRKGKLGVETLNGILQRYLNPAKEGKKEYSYGETLFREGDKVMQIKNNYQLEWEIPNYFGIAIDHGTGVFNGDMGIIDSINVFARHLVVRFEENKRVLYTFDQLDELELAYAVTIHKSQGSEYPAVIMPLLGGPKQLLNRNLLYTGVTRAKKCVTIIGSEETVEQMIQNGNAKKRYTGLLDCIREVKEEE